MGAGLFCHGMTALERPRGAGARIALDPAFILKKHHGLRVLQQCLQPRTKLRTPLFPQIVVGRQGPRARNAQDPAVFVQLTHRRAVAQFPLQRALQITVEFDCRPVTLAGTGRIGQERNHFFPELHGVHDPRPAAALLSSSRGIDAAGIEGADPSAERALADIEDLRHRPALRALTQSPDRHQPHRVLPLRRAPPRRLHLGQRGVFKIGTERRSTQDAWFLAWIIACTIVRVENFRERV